MKRETIHKWITAVVVVAVLAAVVYLALFSRTSKAGQDSFMIPAPKGAKFEVNSRAEMVSQRRGDMLVVMVVDADPGEKAKARWYYAGRNCQSSGDVGRVLSDIERCANDAVRKK